MNRSPSFPLGLCSLIAATALASAQALRVDINGNGDTTASGWTGWDPANPDNSALDTGVGTFTSSLATDGDVDVRITTGSNTYERNYGVGNVTGTFSGATPAELWQDQYFYNQSAAAPMAITLDDLKAGDYEFTIYSYFDSLLIVGPNSPGSADIFVNGVDSGVNATSYGGNDQSGGTSPTASFLEANVSTVAFTVASDNDPVTIDYRNPTTNVHGLNGFQLVLNVPDTTAPSISSLSPPDDASDVSPATTALVATFDENVQPGTGFITIRESVGNAPVGTFAVTSSEITFSGAAVTITPGLSFAANTGYYVQIDTTAIVDGAGNSFADGANSTAWNFTTEAALPPADGRVQTTTDGAGTALQAGWALLDGPRNDASISGSVAGVTITVAGLNGAIAYGRSAGADGGQYLNVDHTDGSLDDLLSGGRLTNTGDALTLTLTGLADDEYAITTYHHTNYDGPATSSSFEFDVLLSDAYGTDILVHDNLTNSQGGTVTTAGLAKVVTNFTVSGGNDVTLTFEPGAGFTVTGGGDQMALNGFEWVATGPDTTDPVIVGLNPESGNDAVLSGNLVATFDDNIVAGTGFITIHEAGGAVFESFNVATSPQLTFSTFGQGTVTIDPTGNFAPGADYYVLIDPTAVDDTSGNSFAGITSPATWTFTGDGTAPSGTGSPGLDASGALLLTFDEDVLAGPGSIVIRKASDGSAFATFAATSTSVTVNGFAVTIQPGSLDPDSAYYVEIDAGAFTDLSGNSFAGFSGSSAWTLTTPDASLAGVPPAGGGTSLGTAFDTWIAQFPDIGTHIGPYHNPDESRFNSFGEFAFDGHPLLRGNAEGVFPGKVNTVGGEPALTLTVPVRDGAVFSGSPTLLSDPVDGVSYGLEATRDLGTWDVGVSEVTGPDATTIQSGLPALSPGWSYRTFRVAGSTASEPKMFFRAFADDIPTRIQQARDSAVIAGYSLGKVKRWLHEVALPKINSNDLFVAWTSGSARYSSLWNYDDTAADCLPFLVWAAYFTDIDQLAVGGPIHDVLVAEQLHCNLNSTPGSAFGRVPTAVNPDTLVKEIKNYENTMFAASEYVKDGLIAIVEVLGKDNPWFDRMQGIIDDMWANAQVSTPYGLVPTQGVEANGEQLQALARLYTMTGDPKYLDWGERIADTYLLPGGFVPSDLNGHGNEIITGLGLFYAVESIHRPAKAAAYKPHIEYMLDEILDRGTNADGFTYTSINGGALGDCWGYNYVAFVSYDLATNVPRYSLTTQQTLRNLAGYTNYTWSDGSIDGYADSVEGGLYSMNRFQVPEALAWADGEMVTHVTKTQNPDVNTTSLWTTYKLECNAVRTVLQHAMFHTRGLIARPWQLDLELGASQTANGVVVKMESASGWTGNLQADKPRHRLEMGFAKDWARMNSMPEWFVAEPDEDYVVEDLNTGAITTHTGAELHAGVPVTLGPGVERLFLIRPLAD